MNDSLTREWIVNSLMEGQNFASKFKRVAEVFDEYKDTVNPSYKGLAAIGTDLDSTMVFSNNSMRVSGPIADDLLFKVVEMHENLPLCYMTSAAYLNLELINNHAHLIPVTTRTEEQFKRIKMPGTTKADFESDRIQYAVTTNGARILLNGVEDKEWTESITAGFGKDSGKVEEAYDYLKRFETEAWVKSLRNAADCFLYMVVHRTEMPEHVLSEITAVLASMNWTVSLQGRKIYFVPEFISKGKAFKEVVRRLGADYSIGCGDSLLDISLMEAADFSIRPRHGELEDTGYTAPNNIISDKIGIFAGEEITARILAQVYAGNR